MTSTSGRFRHYYVTVWIAVLALIWHNHHHQIHVEAFPTSKTVVRSKNTIHPMTRTGFSLFPHLNSHPASCTSMTTNTASSTTSTTRLFLWNRNEDDELSVPDRIKCCIPYLLPLLDGELFGRYIYERIPPLGFLDSLFIGPLYEFYSQIPFLGLIVFLALTLGTRGNTDMNRRVRFNAQQAALIDVALVFPELIGSGFEGEDIPRYLVEPCMNFVWYTYMSVVLYCIYTNLRGKSKPDQIPWISGYADLMVGPF